MESTNKGNGRKRIKELMQRLEEIQEQQRVVDAGIFTIATLAVKKLEER